MSTLRTFVEKYVQHTTRGKLYTCFVDFKKAFDSIWHKGLLHKLYKAGIGGKFLSLVKHMYSETTCRIKIGKHSTNEFRYNRGVRQDCVLSPQLFNIYINDFATSLQGDKFDPILLPNGQRVNCLLNADDMIVISRTARGRQNSIDTLFSFCKTWKLKVIFKKTKVMTFQKKSRKYQSHKFYYNKNEIDAVTQFTYLGTKITSSGDFKQSQEHLRDKALYAFAALSKKLNLTKLCPRVCNKIFDAFIAPILTYNAEVLGCL